MTPRAFLFSAFVIAFYSTVADALPAKYVSTAIENSQTCTYAVKWDAPKTPQRPELGRWPQLPIGWLNFNSERQRWGYNPLFQPGPVSFAYNGRPLIRDRNLNLQLLRDDGTWQTISLFDVAKESLARQDIPWRTSPLWDGSPLFAAAPEHEQRVVFDRDCHAYTVINAFRSSVGKALLLHSPDGGHSWAAYPLPGWSYDGSVRMELPSNTQHVLNRPPVIVLHRHLPAPGVPNRSVLLFPEKAIDGTLNLVDPNAPDDHLTVEDSICCSSPAGFGTHVIGDGELVHFAFPGGNLEKINGRWGTPQFVMTFRRSDRTVVSDRYKVGIGYDGPAWGDALAGCDPVPNVPRPAKCVVNPHNQASLAIDSDGFLHVVIGGHGAEMKYRKSLEPHTTNGWSPPEEVGLANDSYTYPALLIDDDDKPHVVSRWSNPNYRFLLVHRMRSASDGWGEQTTLLDPGRQYYGNWHHRVSIDPWNRIFVSYSYTPGNLWADEARQFASVWGLNLTKVDPTCPDWNVNDQGTERATYCAYNGYDDLSPGLLARIGAGASFPLATTRTFFDGVPATPVDGPTDTSAAIKMLLLDN